MGIEVRLIDYTGNGHNDPLFAARLLAYTKDTRLQSDPDSWDRYMNMEIKELNERLQYVAKSIRSPWEVVDFTFHVKGVTRACANQMTRTRHASFAQAAMRVVDAGDAEVMKPDTVSKNNPASEIWDEAEASIMDAYRNMGEAGIPNQDRRGILPLHITTSLIGKYDLRCLTDTIGKRLNLRVQSEYNEVAQQMYDQVMIVAPWAHDFIMPERTNTPNLDAILAEALGDAGPLDKPQVNEALKELDQLKGTWG